MPVSRIHVPGKRPGYLYMLLQLRLLFIEQGRLSCFLALTTPGSVCVRTINSNDIKIFTFWTLTVHKHYTTSTSLLDTERDDVISSQSYLCCITSLSGGRLLSNTTAMHPPSPPRHFVVASCNLLFLVGVIDPISTSATESSKTIVPCCFKFNLKCPAEDLQQETLPIILRLACESKKVHVSDIFFINIIMIFWHIARHSVKCFTKTSSI